MTLHRTASAGAALELQGISKRFGSVTALKPFDLTIPGGALIALLGPSGCGKTTTLRIVAGFERPDTGRVRVGTEDITFLPANKRRLGMVFQNYSLFPHMTVAQNIGFGLKMAGKSPSEIERATREALKLVKLSGFGERYVHQLSGGQQQRIALARSVVTSPAVLLLDEPLGALDKNLRESMQFELRQLQQSLGITSVLVTHDQEEALTMSDLVAVMRDGEILQYGPPREVYDRPQTRFVAEFLGAANILDLQDGAFIEAGYEAQGAGDLHVLAAIPSGQETMRARLASVRPEKVELHDASRTVGTNAMAVTVTGHVFRGSYHAFQLVREATGQTLVAYLSPREFAGRPLALGHRVVASWQPEDVVLLKE